MSECLGASAPREYTGAIAPVFGENVITHDCGCGASAPRSDGSSSAICAIAIGVAVGIAVAALTKGGAQ